MTDPGFARLRPRLEEAARLHQSGQRARAIALYRKLHAEAPQLPPLLNLFGLALVQEGKVQEGLPLLSEAVSLAPDFAGAWLNLAFAQYEAGDRAGAIASYRRLLQLQPDNLTALLSFASLIAEDNAAEAISLLRRATQLAPNRSLPWLRLRRISAFYGDRAGVAEADRHIASARLESPEEKAEGAAIHMDRGEYETAAALYRAALERRPDLTMAAFHLGMALAFAGDPRGAREAYRRATALAPRLVAPWIGLGEAEAALGEREAAAVAFREALQRDAGDTIAQHLLDAALGRTTAAAPAAFVRRNFSELAACYDSLLARDGDLRAPAQIAQHLLRLLPGRLFGRFLDIGCGTGALARRLAVVTRERSGTDLSRRMLDWARDTRLYDDLIEQDPIAYLAGTRERFELITAAEALTYIGDLAPLFDQVQSHLKPTGVFALTFDRIEPPQSGDYALRADGRYAQAEGYVSALGQQRELAVLHLERIDLKRERGAMTPAVLALFQQPG